jgi:uncharacterized membrane protein (UPF0127 family)
MYWKVNYDMAKLMNIETNEIILQQLVHADHFLSRLRGLMWKKALPENTGLMINPCNIVHCFFMKFQIDVVFVNKNHQVVHIISNMRPGSISPIVKQAKYVVESNANTVSRQVKIGDRLSMEKSSGLK